MRTLLALLLLTIPAQAQMPCAPLESVLTNLHSEYGEVIEWEGFIPGEQPSEVLLLQSPSGSWTLLRVIGISACIIAGGEAGTSIVTGQET